MSDEMEAHPSSRMLCGDNSRHVLSHSTQLDRFDLDIAGTFQLDVSCLGSNGQAFQFSEKSYSSTVLSLMMMLAFRD